MEQNKPKFRLKLNLFDGIVLAVALLIAALLAWVSLHPLPTNEDDSEFALVQYTLRLNRWPEGTSRLVRIGDELKDNLQNRELGKIVDMRVEPARTMNLNQEKPRYELAEVAGYEEVVMIVETVCKVNDYGVTLGNGSFTVRIGNPAYFRGPGYMSASTIEAVEILEILEDFQEVEE